MSILLGISSINYSLSDGYFLTNLTLPKVNETKRGAKIAPLFVGFLHEIRLIQHQLEIKLNRVNFTQKSKTDARNRRFILAAKAVWEYL